MNPFDINAPAASSAAFNTPQVDLGRRGDETGTVSPAARLINSVLSAPEPQSEVTTEPKPFNLTGRGTPRPLSGTAARAADDAAEIVASPLTQAKKLRALADLRENAMADDDAKTAVYLETVGVRQLFAPIGESVVSMPERFIDELGFLPGRLFTDNTPEALETLKADLARLKKELGLAGQLTPEAADAFDYLRTLTDDKSGVAGLINLARTSYRDGNGRVSLREAADMSLTAAVMARGDGPGRPAFSHVLMRGLAAAADKDVSLWSQRSRQNAKPLADAIAAAKASLSAPEGLMTARSRVDELKAQLVRVADTMLAVDEAALFDSINDFAEAIRVREITGEARAMLDTVRVPVLRDMKERLEGLRTNLQTRDPNVRETLDRTIGDLAQKIIRAESEFEARFLALTNAIEAAAGEPVDSLQPKIDSAREVLRETDIPTPARLIELNDRLSLLEDEAFAAPYLREMTDTFSASLDAPSAQTIADRIAGDGRLSREKKGVLLSDLAADSAAVLTRLADRLARLEDSLATLGFDDLRALDLRPFTGAGEKLTVPDAARYTELFNRTMRRIESALFTSVAARPEVNALGAEAKEGLRTLLKASAYHPSVLKALQNEDVLPASLLKAIHEAAATSSSLTSDLTKGLDRLALFSPELDPGLLTLSVGLVPDSDRAGTAAHRLSVSIRRDTLATLKSMFTPEALKALGVEGDLLDTDTLRKLVKASAGDRKLHRADLLLAGALWFERQAQGVTFEAFRATLPAKLAERPALQAELEAGLRNSTKADDVLHSAAKISGRFGGRRDLEKIVERLTASDDRYAAGRALTRMTHAHLSKPGQRSSFGGRDAMAGDASALKMAVEADRSRVSEAELFAAKMKVFFKKAEGITLEGAADQLSAFISKAEDLRAEYDRLSLENTKLANAATALLTTPDRKKYLAVLTEARPDDSIVASLQNGDTKADDLEGAEAAMATVILNTVLRPELETPSANQLIRMQEELKPLSYQNHLNIMKMRGQFVDWSEEKPETQAFRTLLEAFQTAPTAGNRRALLDFIDSKSLMLRADAVLYFKHPKEANGSQNLIRKIAQVYHTDNPDLMKAVTSRVSDRAQSFGLAERQNQGAEALREMRRDNVTRMEAELNKAYGHFSTRVAASIDNTVSMAVCEAFLAGKGFDSAAQLVADRAHYEKLSDWPFYQAVESETSKLGLAPAVASPFILKALAELTPETFRALNTATARSPRAIADKMAEQLRRDPKAMADMVKLGRFEALADRVIDRLADPGQTLVLKHSHSAKMEIPVFESGLAEVAAKVSLAGEKGVSLWKGDDGRFNMVLMGKHAAAVGAAVSAFDEKMKLDADVSGNLGRGCALTFDSDANCSTFLAHLMAGQFVPDDLSFVSGASPILSGGFGASLNIGVEFETSGLAGVAAQDILTGHSSLGEEGTIDRLQGEATVDAGLSLSGSLQWTRTENRSSTVYENERRAAFTGALGITTAPEAEEEDSTDDVTEGEGTEEAGDDEPGFKLIREDGLRPAEEAPEPEDPDERTVTADALFTFDVKESITVSNDGRLLAAQAVRRFDPADTRGVDRLLLRQGVTPAAVEAVMHALEATAGPLRLEVRREVPQSVVDRLVESGTKLRPADYRTVEVRILSTDGAAAIRRGIETEHLALAGAMDGAFTRVRRFNARF